MKAPGSPCLWDSSLRKCGQSHGIPGLKWPHTALFLHGRNGQTWESPHQSTDFWEILPSLLKRGGPPDLFSLLVFLRKQLGKDVGSTFRRSQVRKQALHGQERWRSHGSSPCTQPTEANPNKQPLLLLHMALSSDASACRTAACGLQHTRQCLRAEHEGFNWRGKEKGSVGKAIALKEAKETSSRYF